jgi:hypothetical protein
VQSIGIANLYSISDTLLPTIYTKTVFGVKILRKLYILAHYPESNRDGLKNLCSICILFDPTGGIFAVLPYVPDGDN